MTDQLATKEEVEGLRGWITARPDVDSVRMPRELAEKLLASASELLRVRELLEAAKGAEVVVPFTLDVGPPGVLP